MQTVKMVVTGPFNAGKTEFIQAVSEINVVSTERKISSEAERVKQTTTVAMDFGRITVDEDLVLYLFGTPGQKRFDFMWEILSEGMLGFIVMVDSTRPETFREARSILETFRAYAPTPYVVAANKQDIEDAWEMEDLVTSPTFTLVNEYRDERVRILHLDLYRLNSLPEIEELGLEDDLSHCDYAFIEWPEIAAPVVTPVMRVKTFSGPSGSAPCGISRRI